MAVCAGVCHCRAWASYTSWQLAWRASAVAFLFVGIAVVCDDYFTPALEVLSEVWGLSDDVAVTDSSAAHLPDFLPDVRTGQKGSHFWCACVRACVHHAGRHLHGSGLLGARALHLRRRCLCAYTRLRRRYRERGRLDHCRLGVRVHCLPSCRYVAALKARVSLPGPWLTSVEGSNTCAHARTNAASLIC
eukprot:SAG31_NODE_16811_length_695_cov_0.565436_1_plen_190_part_00